MKITGLQSCLNALRFDESRIETILETAGSKILADTKSGVAEVDTEVANTYNKITEKEDGKISVNVGSDDRRSAWTEFGTGEFVVIPDPATPEYAMNWYINGKGKRRPHASLMPAFKIEKPNIIQDIKDELNRQF